MAKRSTDIPVLSVSGNSIAEAWEKSILKLYEEGVRIKTQYDKLEDPPSIDSTMIITVENPLSEPMIHKEMPMGIEDLQEYAMEVCDGIKDHMVRDKNDPNDKRWQYTYHQRLFGYDYVDISPADGGTFSLDQPIVRKIDQFEVMAHKLAECSYTRRAQMITWKVWEDNECEDPACLQSLWARCLEDDHKELWLNTNVRFRSNDAYKAAQCNMYAIVRLVEKLANRVSELTGKPVNLGRYVHMADSYHLYGSYFKEFDARWWNGMTTRTFEERTLNYCDVKDVMTEAIPVILEKMKTFGK